MREMAEGWQLGWRLLAPIHPLSPREEGEGDQGE